jgi:hypothetical protein
LNNEHSQSTQISSENKKQRASSSTASQLDEESSLDNTHNSKKRTNKKDIHAPNALLSEDDVE